MRNPMTALIQHNGQLYRLTRGYSLCDFSECYKNDVPTTKPINSKKCHVTFLNHAGTLGDFVMKELTISVLCHTVREQRFIT